MNCISSGSTKFVGERKAKKMKFIFIGQYVALIGMAAAGKIVPGLVKLVFEEDSRNSRFSSYSLKILSDETRENQL